KDDRIRVIHKENGGLSDARNAGMQLATGTYTMFVDSDDWIEPKMVETMVEMSRRYAAQVVQAAFYYAYDDKLLIDTHGETQEREAVCLNRHALMYELVKNKRVKNFAWGKLYETKLIKK